VKKGTVVFCESVSRKKAVRVEGFEEQMADESGDDGGNVVLKVLKVVFLVLLSPLILGVILFGLAVWFVCTITCIGPLLNYLFNSSEAEGMNDNRSINDGHKR